MGLTQQQWYDKIRKWVPSWYFEENVLAPAIFKAMAAVFSQLQTDIDDAQAATFITRSAAPVLDLHGDERRVARLTAESDASYAARIQKCLFQSVGYPSIKASFDALLFNNPSFFIENVEYGFWDDPDISSTPGYLYYDDYYSRWIDDRKNYNWWTVIIQDQTGAPSLSLLRTALVASIENNKALGTTYDILDETGGSAYLGAESGLTLATEGGSGIVI